jgi:hypothetical protein
MKAELAILTILTLEILAKRNNFIQEKALNFS